MKEIVKQPTPIENEPLLFKCHECETEYMSDEYKGNGAFKIDKCPQCNEPNAILY